MKEFSPPCSCKLLQDSTVAYNYWFELSFYFRYAKGLENETEKNKWIKARQEIQKEFQIVKDISKELSSFKVLPYSFFGWDYATANLAENIIFTLG